MCEWRVLICAKFFIHLFKIFLQNYDPGNVSNVSFRFDDRIGKSIIISWSLVKNEINLSEDEFNFELVEIQSFIS